jgi:hypothetical protein
MQILVKTATASEKDPIFDVLVLAFSTDPAARWMYPDPHQYLSNFPSFVRAFGSNAFTRSASVRRSRFSHPMTPLSLSANAVVDYYKAVGFDD